MNKKWRVLSANNQNLEICQSAPMSYDEAKQFMLSDFEGVRNNMDDVLESEMDDFGASIYDGDELYYWNIVEEEPLTIKTPAGDLLVEKSGCDESYPGVSVSLIKLADKGEEEKERVACVEYETAEKELRIEAYEPNCDSPTHIIRYSDGTDLL